MSWRKSKKAGRLTDEQKEFLEKLFALAKEYEVAGVMASGMGDEGGAIAYVVRVEVTFSKV